MASQQSHAARASTMSPLQVFRRLAPELLAITTEAEMQGFVVAHCSELTPAFFAALEELAFPSNTATPPDTRTAGILATCAAELGNLYYGRRDYQRAVECYDVAYRTAQRLDNDIACKNLLYALGQAQVSNGHLSLAEATFEMAWAYAERLEGDEHDVASLGNIGTLLAMAGKWEQAISFYLKARAKLASLHGTPSRFALLIDVNLGNAHRQLGDLRAALSYYEHALAHAHNLKDRRGENRIISSKGIVFRDLGQMDTARMAFEKSLAIARAANDEVGVSDALGNLGNLAYQQADFHSAQAYYQEAIEISLRLGDHHFVCRWRGNLANVYAALGLCNRARAYYEEALQLATQLSDLDHQYLWNFNLGRLYWRDSNQTQKAYECFVAAVGALDELRRGVLLDDFSRNFAESKVLVFQCLVNVCLEIKQRRIEAIGFAEAGKAYTLTRMMGEANLQPSNNVPPDLRLECERLQLRRMECENRLRRGFESPDAGAAPDALLYEQRIHELLSVRERQTRVIHSIAEYDPTFGEIYSGSPVTVSRIQQHLDDHHPRTALVEFFVTTDQTVAFIVTPSTFEVVPIPQLPEREVNRIYSGWVARYYEFLSAYADAMARPQQETRDAQAAAFQSWLDTVDAIGEVLAAKLWRPLQVHIEKAAAQNLVLVPHAALHLLPLHLVVLSEPSRETEYLCDAYNISYSPNFRILEYCYGQSCLSRQQQSLLAVSNPSRDLPWADVATDTVRQLFRNVQELRHEQASYQPVVNAMPDYDILNFACHGLGARRLRGEESGGRWQSTGQKTPLHAHLVLAGERNLMAYDMFASVRLPRCHTAVLGACETGVVQLDQGDEYIGLPAAFLYAGAAGVVSSLWSVESMATAILTMRWFQRFIEDGLGRREALTTAQADIRKLTNAQLKRHVESALTSLVAGSCGLPVDSPELQQEIALHESMLETLDAERPDAAPYRHPFFWGGFIVSGNAA